MPPGRTSMLEPPTIDPLAIHPASSGKRHHQPCRPFHERKLGDQTKDDIDKEPREERSCGRSQTLLYNNERPHQALDMQCPAQRYRPSPRPYRGLPDIEYPFHDRAASPPADESASIGRRSISARCSPARPSASNKPMSGFGSSALWIMISDISTTRPAGSNPLQIPSDQKCYLCRRYKP